MRSSGELMTPRELLLLSLVISAPVTLALIVAFLRGYTISLHMTRGNHHRRGDD
jgi:hypothetical protein